MLLAEPDVIKIMILQTFRPWFCWCCDAPFVVPAVNRQALHTLDFDIKFLVLCCFGR